MTHRIAQVLSSTFVVALLCCCGSSPPSRFYTLESTAEAEGHLAAGYGVEVGPVSIPASVDRPEFVIQIAPNRVRFDEFDRWAAPLDENIARVVAGDLSALLGTPRVTTEPRTNSQPRYQVTIDVQRFDSIPDEAVVVEAFWAVRDLATAAVVSNRTVAREPAQGGSLDALAAAHSRALGKLSGDIAAAIRAEAGKQP